MYVCFTSPFSLNLLPSNTDFNNCKSVSIKIPSYTPILTTDSMISRSPYIRLVASLLSPNVLYRVQNFSTSGHALFLMFLISLSYFHIPIGILPTLKMLKKSEILL